mmetsp:Transcript_60775/g.71117  ORF Transcript_60775/g.71117 Transcript_60775/m.71117 type:complete len:214 (-) Transcript_60775:266-907(-)
MKAVSIIIVCAASASAFTPQVVPAKSSVVLNAESRREALKAVGAAIALAPTAALASAGESPRFSVFGLIGDGTSYSEGGAYGSDQSTKTYSPYSVYGDESKETSGYLVNGYDKDFDDKKKAVIKETVLRLDKLDRYIARSEWFNVKDELTRYMGQTRFAVRGLSKTADQKEKAAEFFKSMEAVYTFATLKKGEQCASALSATKENLKIFQGTL